MWVRLSIEMDPEHRQGASILWTDNDRPLSTNAFDAQGILREPGEHVIAAHITTADDRKIVLTENITVFAQPTSQPAQ